MQDVFLTSVIMVMAFHLLSTKPLPGFYANLFKKMNLKMLSTNCWPFCSGLSE